MTQFDLDAEFAAAAVRVNARIDQAVDHAIRRLNRPTPGEIRGGIRKPSVTIAALIEPWNQAIIRIARFVIATQKTQAELAEYLAAFAGPTGGRRGD